VQEFVELRQAVFAFRVPAALGLSGILSPSFTASMIALRFLTIRP